MAAISVARSYQRSFDSHPNSTLAITGGAFNSLGDCVAQVSQNIFGRTDHEPRPGYDIIRTARFFCFGFLISPLIGKWNGFLERQFPLRTLSGSNKVSIKALSQRVLADQLLMAPLGLACFLGSMGVMEGRTPTQIKQKYQDLYKPAIVANWQVWPVAQLVNFRYMPLPYRVPFSSTCGVAWTLYLSILNSKEDKKQDREVEMRQTLSH